MGTSTVPCMMATSPLTSSAPYSAGKGQCNHKPAYRVSVASLEATGRLSMTVASNKQQNKTEGAKHREKRRGESKTDIKRKPNKTAFPTSLKAKGPTGQGTNPIFFKASDKVARAHLSC
jgi:hypothetical protein